MRSPFHSASSGVHSDSVRLRLRWGGRGASWLLAMGLLLVPGCRPASNPASEQGAAAEGQAKSPIATDSRVLSVFELSLDQAFFERNLSDPVPILIDRLRSGQSEPLRRATEELGALGADSIEALKREIERGQRDAAQTGPLQNVVTALSLNSSPRAPELLVELLGHPDPTLRRSVLRALSSLDLRPEFAQRLEWSVLSERGGGQTSAALAFARSDPDRAAYRFLEWLQADQLGSALDGALQHLASHPLPDVASHNSLLEDLAPELPPARGAYLYARLAADGSQDALERLAEIAESDKPAEHRGAVQAAFFAGVGELLIAVASEDPRPSQRVAALTALGQMIRGEADKTLASDDQRERALGTLRRALDDPDRSVRDEALANGILLGEDEARSRALAVLDGSQRDLIVFSAPISEALQADPEFTQRALDRLLARLEREQHLSLTERLPLLQILGLVPHEKAAEFIVSQSIGATERLETLRAHEFLTLVASNAGLPGRRYLAERLTEETDPLRRLDLIWALTSARDDLAREVLEQHVELEDIDPLERLYAASCLAQVGPTQRVAPRLKRVALRMDGEARRGMNRLLHYWYGRSELP